MDLRKYYASRTDEELLRVAAEGESSYEPGAWETITGELTKRPLNLSATSAISSLNGPELNSRNNGLHARR
jgi:hypothetical protein